MLNWIRVNLFKRQTSPSRSVSESQTLTPNNKSTMISESTSSIPSINNISLNIIYEGEIWEPKVHQNQVISDLINMAVNHFLDPNEANMATKFQFISVATRRVLHPQLTVQDEQLNNEDELLLSMPKSTGATNPVKLTVRDIKGPSKEEIKIATANVQQQNPLQVVPSLECQENFQLEIRKVLYSLIEASAKILAYSPDAKVVFDDIAARINAKNKKEIDKNAVKYLKDLGFTEQQARYALRLKRNRQVEAMEWLLENSQRVKGDEDIASTSTDHSLSITSDTNNADPLHTINKLLQDIRDFHRRHFEPCLKTLRNLQEMGFNTDDIIEALQVTDNNQVAACEWLCGERDASTTQQAPGLDTDGPLYRALINDPAIQLGLHNPKVMLAFLSILENPSSANLWLNDVDTAPVLGQVFKTYHTEKHIMVVNQQVELMRRQLSS